MAVIIVGGGSCDEKLIKDTILSVMPDERHVIACDRGVAVLLDMGVVPEIAIGDFDSAPVGTYERALGAKIETIKLNPIKDDTDAEAALNLAMDRFSGDIYFLGGTGTRLDHVLGNISLLGRCLQMDRRLYLLDTTNKVYMLKGGESYIIKKDQQYGRYVSLVPYMSQVNGVTLRGFKYPLSDASVNGFNTLTISNELVDEEGIIELKEGYLLVLETKD